MMSPLVIVGFLSRPRERTVLGRGWTSRNLFTLYLLNTWLLYQYPH